jgi:peptidyl-prolyl cis-trans isomerase C
VSRPGLWLGLWLGCSAACGQTPDEALDGPAGPKAVPAAPVALPAPPANGRMVVAEVDGAPVYEDCVATQAATHALDRRAALDDCIAFELLAQEAERRGLAAHPEVRRAQKHESARRLIDEEFLARYPDPGSVPRGELEAIHAEYRRPPCRPYAPCYLRPEFRETTHVRVPVPEKEHPPGSPADAEARALMEQVHAALAGRRNVTREDLQQAMADVVGERRTEIADLHPIYRQDLIVEPYLAATFAIPEPGMVSPPFRTEWGWDIVLLRRLYPAIDKSVEDVKDEVFEILRRRLYQRWVASLLSRAGIEIHEDTLAALQAADERARFAEPTGAPGAPPEAPGAPGSVPGSLEGLPGGPPGGAQ